MEIGSNRGDPYMSPSSHHGREPQFLLSIMNGAMRARRSTGAWHARYLGRYLDSMVAMGRTQRTFNTIYHAIYNSHMLLPPLVPAPLHSRS